MKRLQRTEDSVTCNNIYIYIYIYSYLETLSISISFLLARYCTTSHVQILYAPFLYAPHIQKGLITARKRSLRRLCFYTCLSVILFTGGGCYPSMPCRWYPIMPCSRSPGGSPGPYPRGKLRGIWSRPTPKGEVEGDLVQAHTQGGSWWGSGPGPHSRGNLRGIWPVGGACSRWGACSGRYLLLGGGVSAPGGWRPPMMATAAGGKHPTGMHSC